MLTVSFNCTITAECDICHLQTVVTGPKRQTAEEELQKRGWNRSGSLIRGWIREKGRKE